MDEHDFTDWIGRSSEVDDVVTPRLVESYRAVLDPFLAPVAEGCVPHCFQWCLTPPIAPMDRLGPDGHPAKNRDIPPVPLPRRMWAGGSIETLGEIREGDAVRRVSTIAKVERKVGRSGELWFVTIGHNWMTSRGLAVREEQDLVYRAAVDPAAPRPAPAAKESVPERGTTVARAVIPGPVMLFRYSALTFNGHRIHYDEPYATGVEGYEGLVVHGPLQATLLFNLAAMETGAPPRRFRYRGLAPAIAGRTIEVCRGAGADAATYFTRGADGTIHMEATVD